MSARDPSEPVKSERGLAVDYPPSYHLLRELGIWLERGEAGSRAGLEVTEHLCSDAGGARTGVLATLVDVIGGTVQGGALAVLADVAAEAAGRAAGSPDWVTTDLGIHYLALGRRGPTRAAARILRTRPGSALVRIEVRDTGADDRLVAVATANMEAPS